MSKSSRYVVAVTLLVSYALGLPVPDVVYTVNPDPVNKADMIPTATPLVLSSTSAFVCYQNMNVETSYCQMVSPANQAFVAPRVTLSGNNYFDNPPLTLSPVSALYTTSNNNDGSYFAMSSDTQVGQPKDRYNSTARAATNPNRNIAFVPYGVHMGDDFLLALNANNPANTSWAFHVQPWTGTYPNGESLLHDVIFYNGLLLFMHNNTFYKFNATDGTKLLAVPDPCGVGLGYNSMNLAKGTFGSDINGALDAFIVYGNTSTATQSQFVVCRVSHNSGTLSWKYVMADDFIVDDIVGGNGVLLLSGRAVSSGTEKFATLVLDAALNVTYGIIPRQMQDFGSFPIFVPQAVMPASCGAAIVLQQNGNLTALCLNPMFTTHTIPKPLWVSPYGSYHRTLYDPISTQLVCVALGNGIVSILASTGVPVWLDESRAITTEPVLMIEVGVSYAFTLDLDANLVGYQIALSFTTPTPVNTPTPTTAPQGNAPPSDGVSGGTAAGIAIGVIVAVAALAGGIFMYRKSQRRSSYEGQPAQSMNTEYGSVA